jgi:chemotaxis protein MotB
MAEQPIIVKKRIVAAHAHHGGSWKVAYADFVTAMMAFFLVMWLTNLSQDTKDMIQGYFNDPLGFADTIQRSRSLENLPGQPRPTKPGQKRGLSEASNVEQSELSKVEQKLKEVLSQDPALKKLAAGIKISLTSEGLLIEFMEARGAVFFQSGSSVIRPEALKLVNRISPILEAAKHSIEIQGHTDAQPMGGSMNGNWALSESRALAIQQTLGESGVNDKLFVGVSGYAATRLLDPEHPFAAANRRVTILLPRKYVPGAMEAEPADALRAAIGSNATPEAIEVRPDSNNVLRR